MIRWLRLQALVLMESSEDRGIGRLARFWLEYIASIAIDLCACSGGHDRCSLDGYPIMLLSQDGSVRKVGGAVA